MKIKFDITGAPEEPTLVLSTREGKKLGQIAAKEIAMGDYLNEPSMLQFKVYKFIDGVEDPLWDQYTNFKLVWCQDWDMWFQMVVDVEETTETVKSCECTKLGEAELSQIMLYNIEINTENDILRDDYEQPTVFYDPEHPEASLLNRMMEKAPHYSILHVDSTLANIQRTFTFDNESIYDSFQDVAEEIGCLFVFDSNSDEDGNIARTISVYDLESNCLNCGYRGEFTGVCPECGSTDIDEGYGEDTTIFVTADELSDDVLFTTDTDAVKNCFRLEAGDDLTTATVRNCNPNGSQYIYYFSDDTKAEMPTELVEKIDSYDELYNYYQNEYVISFEDEEKEAEFEKRLNKYNELVVKYQEYNEDLQEITLPIVGYPALMNAYYETIDFLIYLQSGLMPKTSMPETTAEIEAAKIRPSAFTGGLDSSGNTKTGVVAVANMTNFTSAATASNAVVNMAKCIVDMRYQIKSISGVDPSDPSEEIPRMTDYKEDENGSITATWTGALDITNYSDDSDTCETEVFSLTVNGDYEDYLYQCIQKTINSENTEDMSMSSLFSLDYEDFVEELKKYCLDSLNMFYNACESVLDVLVEQGVASEGNSWGTVDSNSDPYTQIYCPYRDKMNAITEEIEVREGEIGVIDGIYDWEGMMEQEGLQDFLNDARIYIQGILDFEAYLGETLWLQFCAYRREDTYSNSNYISDGLNNAELFDRALEFIEVASKELYKSAELQHSIESDLNNLLVMDKFKPLLKHFEVGNWLRVRIDDIIYKLRLIGYELEWDNIENITLDFSDVMKIKTGVSDLQSIVNQASKMATSYDAVQHQASQGSSAHDIVTGWSVEGLNVTNTKIIQAAEGQTQYWDEHGMLFRKYDDVTESYMDEQMKIVNSTIAITDDNWENVRTAIGRFYYIDPETGMYKEAYGINAEVLIGKLILGEELGLYNESGTMTFDENGLKVYGDDYTFQIDPNSDEIVKIYANNTEQNLFSIGIDGSLMVTNGTYTFKLNPSTSDLVRIYKNSDETSNVLSVTNSGDLYISGTIESTYGHIGGWEIGTNYIRGGSEEYGSTAIVQIPRENSSQSRYWVFAAGGYKHSDHSDCRFRVGSEGDVYCEDLAVKNQLYMYDDNSSEKMLALTATTTTGGSTSTKEMIVGSGADRLYIGAASGYVYTNCNLLVGRSSSLILETNGSIEAHSTIEVISSPARVRAHNSNTGYGITLYSANENDNGNIYIGLYHESTRWIMEYAPASQHLIFPTVASLDSGSYTANVNMTSNGRLRYSTSSSSIRYKNIIKDVSYEDIQSLYSLPVHWYTYKTDYLKETDERYLIPLPGFIAEEWNELMPCAVDHNDDGQCEVWNPNIVTPLMFEMIKNNHSNINSVEDRLDSLQLEVDQLKEENEFLKQELSALTS